MSAVLLDVNVLLALSWDQHVFHAAAEQWRLQDLPKAWASCPITECGFIRISSQPRFRPGGSVTLAMATLQALRKQPGHQFWADDYSPADDALFAKLLGHNQITDAYLLALAHRRKARLATFDRAVQTLAKDTYGNSRNVLLIATK